jgi:site-specific DNA recombinase
MAVMKAALPYPSGARACKALAGHRGHRVRSYHGHTPHQREALMAQTKRRTTLMESAATVQTVAIYARVSTEDQAERATIQSQLDFLRRYVALHDLPVAGEYVDDGISGTVPLARRPEGQRLLIDAEAGRFGAVLVYRVDRLGRDLRALLDAHDALSGSEVAIRSGTEPLDTSTPIGTFIFSLLGSLAELEKSTIAERTSLGRNRVASSGGYTGGPIPIGYDLGPDKRFIASERIIEQLGVTEAELVREIFQRVAGGSSAKAEAIRLAALGIPNRQRYGPSDKHTQGRLIERPPRWRHSTVQNILHNPIYKGEGTKRSQFGDVAVPAPALVDTATWQAAQDALLRNRRLSAKNSQHTYLLRGLIRCANCGATYTGSARRSTHDGQPITVRRYCCAGQSDHNTGSATPRCPGKVLHADWLEEAVWEECRRFIRNPGDALDEARRKLRERMSESAGFEDRRRALLGQLAEKETERERVLSLFRRGTISDTEAERELDAIAKEAGQVREMIESLRAQTALIEAQEAFLTDSATLLTQLQDELTEMEASNDLARKGEVIERYVRQITVETRRVGPRKLEADVRVFLRLKPEPIPVKNGMS